MSLPVSQPLAPMEAELVERIPEGGWQYEPKWDGFRCVVFRDGPKVELQSKSGQPLTRYFPEVVEAFTGVPAKRFVVDGELAVPVGERFSFEDLLRRIHPAECRVHKLAWEHPALYVAFDLLVDSAGKSLLDHDLQTRRKALEEFAEKNLRNERFRLSPATRKISTARLWLEELGGDLDGIVAKRVDCRYLSGERAGMQKVKMTHTADCVVGGFRYAEKQKVVGSLLLGLYDDGDLLHHVGFCSAFKAEERKRLTPKVEALIQAPGFTGHAPGGLSRWSTKRSMEWQPLKSQLVVEVSYDHFTGGRFRHGTRLLRWRPDKEPRQCGFDQVERAGKGAIALLS